MRKLGRGCFLIKLDVSAAYKQIPVRREDWPLLGFMWRGEYYYERVLPFGLRSSCRLWDLYAAALHFCFMHLLGTQAQRSTWMIFCSSLRLARRRPPTPCLRGR